MSVNAYLNVHDALSVIRVVLDNTVIYDPLSVSTYLRLDQLREPDKFFPWLKKIARNRSNTFSSFK